MKFRGFDPAEVSSFMEQLREELEDLHKENALLKEQLQNSGDEIERFRQLQELLSRTLLDARQISDEYKIHGRREADTVIEGAESAIREMIEKAHDQANQVNEEIVDLKLIRKQLHEQMKKVLSRFDQLIATQ